MKESLIKILLMILRPVLFSVVTVFISFSLVTQEFPPRFEKIKNMGSSLKKLSQLNQKVQMDSMKVREEIPDSDVSEVDSIRELQVRQNARAEAAGGILEDTMGMMSGLTDGDSEVQALKARIADLESQLYRLQRRVGALESQQSQ